MFNDVPKLTPKKKKSKKNGKSKKKKGSSKKKPQKDLTVVEEEKSQIEDQTICEENSDITPKKPHLVDETEEI